MVVVSTKEFRNKQKKYFDLAKEERVLIKRGKDYVNLIVTDEIDNNFLEENWIKEFFAIPAEYRVNPFEWSPSGDLFWADKRNVESVEQSIAISEKQYKEGLFTRCETAEEVHKFIDSL
jgi:hypothetical protein